MGSGGAEKIKICRSGLCASRGCLLELETEIKQCRKREIRMGSTKHGKRESGETVVGELGIRLGDLI